MSVPKDPKDAPGGEPEEPRMDDDDVRALLKQAMRVDEAKAPPPDVLRGVQRKIRQRSRGKFYADGWSTAPSPKSTYFVTAAVMLALLVALYFFLVPSGWGTP
jgi:hypothetical protein